MGVYIQGVCIWGGLPPEGSASRRGLPPREVQGIQLGWADPRDTWDTTGYGQQAGGTHPTGIYSCL